MVLRSAFTALVLLGVAAAVTDSLLKNEFCQKYYQGTGDCAALRSRVVANHSRILPTLELGDRTKPTLFFMHGWPDTSALWANQFEFFCDGPDAEYFCVAPSWFDFHPDVPTRPASDLFWDKQVDAFHDVATEMGLTKFTLIIFDFGCITGYQFLYKYHHMVSKVVAMDVGMGVMPNGLPAATPAIGDLLPYQQVNVEAFLSGNNSLMHGNIQGSPCAKCPAITSNSGWPYYQLIRNTTGETWPERLDPHVPRKYWMLSVIPSFPDDLPLLFLYGTCDIGTGCPGCPACVKRSFFFFGKDWIDWIQKRGAKDGASKTIPVGGAGHWIQCRASKATNAAIKSWL